MKGEDVKQVTELMCMEAACPKPHQGRSPLRTSPRYREPAVPATGIARSHVRMKMKLQSPQHLSGTGPRR